MSIFLVKLLRHNIPKNNYRLNDTIVFLLLCCVVLCHWSKKLLPQTLIGVTLFFSMALFYTEFTKVSLKNAWVFSSSLRVISTFNSSILSSSPLGVFFIVGVGVLIAGICWPPVLLPLFLLPWYPWLFELLLRNPPLKLIGFKIGHQLTANIQLEGLCGLDKHILEIQHID